MKFDVAIIGGGVIGASIAYELTKLGIKSVALFEKEYISAGSTGRCGGGIRQQWASPENCRLAVRSVRRFEKLDQELEMDTEYRQGGYLLLAYTDEEEKQFLQNVEMQTQNGVPVTIISRQDVERDFSFLNSDGIRLAAHCPTDGHANPMLVNLAYANAARKNGAELFLFTEVTQIKREGSKLTTIVTDRGDEFQAGAVINAAGGFSAEVAEMCGLSIPAKSQRHEILITEPLERFMEPMVIDFYHHIYFRQTDHGSVIMGHGDPNEPFTQNVKGSLHFMKTMAKQITSVIPQMRNVKIVRQWAGSYNMTPDAQPILGKVPGVDNYYQAVGFSGHGLMLAPAVSEIMAEYIATGKESEEIKNLSISRFEGKTEFKMEKAVV